VLLEELSEVTSALGRVVSCLDGDSLSGGEAAELVERFAAIWRLAAAGTAVCAGRVARTRFFERSGHTSAESWLATTTGEANGAARSLLSTAARLGELPGLDAALRAGELSGPQAAEVARGAGAGAGAEAELLESARAGSLCELRAAADRIEAAARSREADEARHRRIRAHRHLRTWLDADGSLKGRFALAPEDGALLLSGLEAEANHLFDLARRAGLRERREAYLADALVAVVCGEASGAGAARAGLLAAGVAGAHAESGPGPGGADSGSGSGAAGAGAGAPEGGSEGGAPATGSLGPLPRPGPGARDQVASPAGEVAGAPPAPERGRGRRPECTILFHVDLEALRRGSLGPGEQCCVEGGGHVPLSVVQSYLDVARIFLVVKEGFDVTSIVSCKRTIPAALQTALWARDRTCAVPGCSSTFHLEIDHIVEFAKGGPTALGNLVRLCRPHHALKTEQGYRIEGGPGHWRWRAPARPPAGTSGPKGPPGSRQQARAPSSGTRGTPAATSRPPALRAPEPPGAAEPEHEHEPEQGRLRL
jgi:hypothetical protein